MTNIVRRLISNATSGDQVSSERNTTAPAGTTLIREAYNYHQFRFWPASDGIQRGVHAGEQAADATLQTLEGEPIQLSDLWDDGPVVVEFGSITCPIFAGKVDAMDELAKKYADGVDFYVVYTREAHPGQRYHRHTSFEQKCQHARDAKAAESIDRTVLVDDVDGTMHRQYDALPNSVYAIGRDGIVAHRADWLDADRLDGELEELLAQDGIGADVTPTTLEENYHKPETDLFRTMLRVHRRAGAGSLRDMVLAFLRMLAYRASDGLRGRIRGTLKRTL